VYGEQPAFRIRQRRSWQLVQASWRTASSPCSPSRSPA